MRAVGGLSLPILLFLVISERSFVTRGLPLGQAETKEGKPTKSQVESTQGSGDDAAVKELEDLTHTGNGNGGRSREVGVVKSQSRVYTKVDGKEEEHLANQRIFEKDGGVVARLSQSLDRSGGPGKLRTELELPAKGVHRVFEEELPSLTSLEEADEVNKKNVLQYSPQDLADYVFWSGDERGAVSAVQELIASNTLSRDEAILFLEEIKRDLDLIKSQYLASYSADLQPLTKPRDELAERLRQNLVKKAAADFREMNTPLLHEEDGGLDMLGGNIGLTGGGAEDYEEMLLSSRASGGLVPEESLQGVIYQLSRLLFKSSLTKGSAETQEALQILTDFLENEALTGRISKSLEKKVLDVVMWSLSDLLNQYPELVDVARVSLGLPPSHHQGQSIGGGSHRFSDSSRTNFGHRDSTGNLFEEYKLPDAGHGAARQNSGLLASGLLDTSRVQRQANSGQKEANSKKN